MEYGNSTQKRSQSPCCETTVLTIVHHPEEIIGFYLLYFYALFFQETKAFKMDLCHNQVTPTDLIIGSFL